MAEGPHRFGPHPIIGRFACSPSPGERAEIEALAAEIRRADPGLDATEVFGAGVTTGLADWPTLHIHTVDKPLQGGSPVMREHRALLLARDDDMAVIARPSSDFVRYCRDDLGLGRVEVLVPSSWRHRGRLAVRVLQDETLCRRVARLAGIAGGLNVVPYQATGGVWALASRTHRLAGVPVHVGAPPPKLAAAVNNKIWFSTWVARLLGNRALPPTTSASSWAHLADRVRRLAHRNGRVGIKLPSAAGSAGNLVLDSKEILAFTSLRDLRAHLRELFLGLGWTEPFPTLVSVWEDSVLRSPSLQGWIPHPDEGPPILEGVFDQSVTGPTGRFVGCAPTSLPKDVQDRIAAEGARILLLFQHLGWYGRCSLDTILIGDAFDSADLHWVECNGRWGGTSIPMTLVNRLTGNWAHRPFVTVGGLFPEGGQHFGELLRDARSRLFDRDVGRGLVLLSPGPRETGTGFMALWIGGSIEEARVELARYLNDVNRRQRLHPRGPFQPRLHPRRGPRDRRSPAG
ncbi:MAG: hypothetical protein HKO98_00090 [Gemmatimonadetes bacterium]|nr:hypothetical protein [Gemmatimonadota bacterium]